MCTINKESQAQSTRICKVCSIEKTIKGNYYFSRLSDTYSRTCNECKNEQRRRYYIQSGTRVQGEKPEFKVCPNCNNEYPFDKEHFYYRSTVDTYSSYCKTCAKDRKRVKKGRPSQKPYTTENKALGFIERYTRLDSKKFLETSLSTDFIIACLSSNCEYCGFLATGLDRIDNDFGHTKDNCVPCCSDCNLARNENFSYNEMLEIGKTIREVKLRRLSESL